MQGIDCERQSHRQGGVVFALLVLLISLSGLIPEFAFAQTRQSSTLQGLEVDPVRLQAFQQLQAVIDPQRPVDENLAVIDWDAARKDRNDQLVAYRRLITQQVSTAQQRPFSPPLSRQSQAGLRPVHLPVLLPQIGAAVTTRDGGEAGIMLITRAHFYDASFYVDGVSVHVGGNARINHRQSDPAFQARLAADANADGIRISQDEGGYTASFTRYGAAYTVSAECDSRSDARCRNSDLIETLLDQLVVAGGNPEE